MQDLYDAMSAWGLDPKSWDDIRPSPEQRLIKDSRGEQTIYYSLLIEGERAYATWYDCRRGEGDYWYTGKGTRRVDAEWLVRVKALEAEAARSKEQEAEAAAISCRAEYAGLTPCITHPYLERKGVSVVAGLKEDGDALVMPLCSVDGQIHTLQRLYANGDKLLSPGGKKKGHFFPIGLSKSEAHKFIYIVEGLSTGLSVREATGCPVVVAVDKGNLAPVSKAVKKQWTGSEIVFAADNDQRGSGEITRDDNPGVWSAQQAAVDIGASFVLWPEMAGEDWNDAWCRDPEYVKNKLDPNKLLVKASTPEFGGDPLPRHSKHAADSGDIISYGGYDAAYQFEPSQHAVALRADGNPKWFDEMIWVKKPNKALPSLFDIADHHDGKSLNNTVTFIRNEYRGLFVLNEFSDEIIVRTCPPWQRDHEFRVHRITDYDITMMTTTLEHYGFKPSTERTRTAVEAVAAIDRIHPVRQYFNSLEWDGVKRLEKWLTYYCGAESQPAEYLSRVGTCWLVAGVKRVFEPGCVFHNMLVLEGKQNIGKSRTLRELATFGRDIEEEYYTDSIRFGMIDKPSALQILQGKLIVEFGELADMDSHSDESLKAWISQNADEMVKKWEKYATKYPRQFILAGTTNNDSWLKDPTGNRRYWPVRCEAFDIEALKADKEQLWAEAVYLYKQGYQVTMPDSDPIYKLAIAQQSMRLMSDPWEDVLEFGTNNREWVTYGFLYDNLGIPIKDRDVERDRRIRRIMTGLGWVYKVEYALSKTKSKVWVRVK
jgi:predicted P-loop ATPase